MLASLVLAGCGGMTRHRAAPRTPTAPPSAPKPHVPHCTPGNRVLTRSPTVAWVAVPRHAGAAFARPGGLLLQRFGVRNVNGFQTVFGVLGARIDAKCRATWVRVGLAIRPIGSAGWVRTSAVRLLKVNTRISVDLSQHRLRLYRSGRLVLTTPVAVGSPATPTPIGRFYVDQRLVPDDPNGPYGPAALGLSAFSPVLKSWTEGGPVGIHGTDEPSSIGHSVSNGCVRVPNAVVRRLFGLVLAGTPVVIHP